MLNSATLIGNLGKNPELRSTATGQAVASFSLATTETFKDKAGAKQQKTTWHNIVVWGKLAEICSQYLKKGSKAYIEGKIENRSYEDKDGSKKYVSEIVVGVDGKMIMLDGKPHADSDHDSQTQPTQPEPVDDPKLPF
jgi:single-strand DNA-binding protein